MKTLYHFDLLPHHSFISVRLPDTSNSYTYITQWRHQINDEVLVDARGKRVIGIVTAIDLKIPVSTLFNFKCVLSDKTHEEIHAYQFDGSQPTNEREYIDQPMFEPYDDDSERDFVHFDDFDESDDGDVEAARESNL